MRNVKHARRGKASAGFTLVELLVVIVIIGILAALITVVAANAVARANETAIKVELDNLANSFMEYKNRYGAYPPNVQYLALTGPQSQERDGNFQRHLRKAFPRHRETDADIQSLLSLNPPLTPAESVWLFLRGFSPDPEHPLTGPGTRDGDTSASLERLFDFDEARLVPTRPWQPQNGAQITLMAYIPDGITQPFVYFDTSRTLTTPEPYPVMPYYAPPTTTVPRVVPYLEQDPRNPSTRRFVNPDSFQIIAAGLDDDFGEPLTNPPGAPLVPEGPFIGGHSDNLANFSQRNMEDSQP
ncbi:MAG: prepilin-type N-terminal cleavage/methylation domain-containing protein [Pirellulales bacterium]